MKNVKVCAVLASLFVMAFAVSAFAGAQDFILVNSTGFDIYVLNVSPSNTNDWEEDILGSDVFENGETTRVRFGNDDARYWDLRAEFEDKTSISWYNIDLFEVSRITLHRDGTATLE